MSDISQDLAVIDRAALTAQHALEAADGFVVSDQDDMQLAAELIGTLAAARKDIENKRLELVQPIKRVATQIDLAAKARKAPIIEAEMLLKRAVGRYVAETQRAADEERKRLEAEVSTERKVVDPGLVPAVAPTRVQSSTGSIGTRKQWTFEILEPMAVPRMYSQPNELAIREAVRQGTRKIDGVRIYEDIVVEAR